MRAMISMTLSVSGLDEAFTSVRLRAGSLEARTRFGKRLAPAIPHSPRKAAEKKRPIRPVPS